MRGNGGVWWVFDPGDCFAHVLADTTGAEPGVLVTMCGRELPAERTTMSSVPPSLAVCPRRWVLYPHGAGKLGVTLSDESATTLAEGIIGEPSTSAPERDPLS